MRGSWRNLRDLRETWEVSSDSQAFKTKVVKMYRFYVQEDAGPAADGDAPDASDPKKYITAIENSLRGLWLKALRLMPWLISETRAR